MTTLLSIVIFFGVRYLLMNGYVDVMDPTYLKDAPKL